MEQYKCCIGLCVYNSSLGLPPVIENINKISQCFKQTNVIFYYDYSRDNTLNIIETFMNDTNKKNLSVEIIHNISPKGISRTENIANARNGILSRIRDCYNDYEFFIMMDANEYACIGEINIPVFREVFEPTKINEWDAVSFDREAGYYDTWALSFGNYVYSFSHFDNWKKVVECMRKEFNELLNDYKSREEFIPVYSAFNGLAIYKTNNFIDCIYTDIIFTHLFLPSLVEKQVEITGCQIKYNITNDTEHRHFHLQSIKKNNSKIRIFPKYLFFKIPVPNPSLRGPA